MILRTEALVLRIAPFSRTSHVVTWLSPEHGRLSTVVKGACRPKSAFLGQYDLFATNELLFYRRDHNGLHAIRECTPLTPRHALRADWRCVTTASYLADLAARVVQPAQESADLCRLLGDALDSLCWRLPDAEVILRFELALLHQQGLLPHFEPCPLCHTPPRPWLRFALAAGCVCCTHSANPSAASEAAITVHRDVLTYLRQLSPATPESPAPPPPPHLSLGSRRFLGIFMRFHLDTPPAPRRLAFELLETDPATFGIAQGES
ncbi:MAG: DNA repair protein RecO [Kiritimatiellia bacterium]